MSYADQQTDKALNSLERKIAKEYKNAYEEMAEKANKYFATLQDRYDEEFKAFQQGKYTEAEFKAWYRTQVQRGEGYNKMRDDLAKRMTECNKVASAYINDQTPSIYSLNANYTAYEIEKIVGSKGVSADFQLVNEQAIKNLISNNENVTEFRTTSVNPKRDYEWNSDQIRSALTSGILQGKSIDKLSDSFLDVMKRNRSSAIRNARTCFTSAQNAGRNKSAEEAQKMGINVKKQWHSMEDASVRFSHSMLNGQIREIKSPFSNGLMFPADSSGAPAEVYNCRCRMEYVLPDYEDVKSVENFDDTKLDGETYQEWLKRKQREFRNPIPQKNESAFEFTEAKTIKEAEDFARNTLNIARVNYKGIDVKVANEMNRAFTDLGNYSKEALDSIKATGNAQAINKEAKIRLSKAFEEDLRASYPNMGDSFYKTTAETFARRWIKNVNERTYALARDSVDPSLDPTYQKAVSVYNEYKGVFVNEKRGKNPTDMLSSIKRDVAGKFHPEGTDKIKAVFDHECGHILDYQFDLRNNDAIKDLYGSLNKGKIEAGLSGYANKNIKEFIAEAYSEYVNNPNPRSISKIVGEEIDKKVIE